MAVMDMSETDKLVDLQSGPLPGHGADKHPMKQQHHPRAGTALFSIILEPFQWLQMLCSQLNPSFVLGVFLVYGLNQGFAGSFFKVVTDYYWKDVQKVQPASGQLFIGLYYIPWVMKPLWGILTDVFPIKGYRRRPYFILAGVIGMATSLAISGLNLPVAAALACLIGLTTALAIADVTIDACIAKNSIEMKALAPDMQSLCGVCSSAGALLGYSASGFFVHHIGAQGTLGILAIPACTLIGLGIVIYDTRVSHSLHAENTKVVEKLGIAVRDMMETIARPQVWKPSIYMYLSIALSFSTHEGYFYWYTDPKAGPAFSQEFVGTIFAIGAMASIAGVVIYQKTLKNVSFRKVLFFAQLLYGLSGMLDMVFIWRWNLKLGIPDSFFMILEECFFRVISRIRWTPMIVLSTKLCPVGIEGTFFALLMSIDSLGALTSKWGGGMVLHYMGVTRTDFRNLWLAMLLRNALRFATLGLIFLIPEADQTDNLIPSDLLGKSSDFKGDGCEGKEEALQLVPVPVNDNCKV